MSLPERRLTDCLRNAALGLGCALLVAGAMGCGGSDAAEGRNNAANGSSGSGDSGAGGTASATSDASAGGSSSFDAATDRSSGGGNAGSGGAGGTSGGASGAGGSSAGAGGAGGAAGVSGAGGVSGVGGVSGAPIEAGMYDVDFTYTPPTLNRDACAATIVKGQPRPIDMYIMDDQSLSMGCNIPSGGTRWDAMKSALQGFINSSSATGISVGIQYFGRNVGSCTASDYATPDVEIAPLPGNATALNDSLNAHMASDLTPTPPAEEGAIDHARDWASSHPGDIVVVVLATDGQPNTCGNVQNVVQNAAAGLSGTPSISTYVIGIIAGGGDGGSGCLVDPNPPNVPDLDSVASAGGTTKAFIVDATQSNTTQQFLDALHQIQTNAALPCQFQMPKPAMGVVDPAQVEVTWAPSAGSPVKLPHVNDAGSCAGDGWYYDDNVAPSTISLCTTTCNAVKADPNGLVNISLGCLGG